MPSDGSGGFVWAAKLTSEARSFVWRRPQWRKLCPTKTLGLLVPTFLFIFYKCPAKTEFIPDYIPPEGRNLVYLSVYSPVSDMVQALGCPHLPNIVLWPLCVRRVQIIKLYTLKYIQFLSVNYSSIQMWKKKKEFPRVTVKAKGPAFFLSIRQREESFPQNEYSARRARVTCPHIHLFLRAPGSRKRSRNLRVQYVQYFLSPNLDKLSTGPTFGESHLAILPEAGITILAYCSWQKEKKRCAPPWSQHLIPQIHSVYGTRS